MKNNNLVHKGIRVRHRLMGFIGGLLCSLIWMGCGSLGSKECTYEAPEPIFEGVEGLENHEFELTGNESIERVDIPEPRFNLSIELYQSGCDIRRQEYRIITHEPYEASTPAPVCVAQIANIFRLLAERDAVKLGPLYGMGDVLLQNAKRFEYNEKVPIREGGIFVQVDKVHQTNGAILTLVLSE